MQIEIKNMSKDIKGTRVLNNINANFTGGKIYGLRGKNGSGKTMLMRCLCGFIIPTEGSIMMDKKLLGKDISFPESIGALIENPSFLAGYTGLKNLKILASIKDEITEEQVKNALLKVGLDPEDKRKYRKYSLGMKQRLGIACAIMENPKLIILDEPINALDEKGVQLLKSALLELKQAGSLIIVACHDKEELDCLSDEIYCLENGNMFKEEA